MPIVFHSILPLRQVILISFSCRLAKKTSSAFLPLTFTSWGNPYTIIYSTCKTTQTSASARFCDLLANLWDDVRYMLTRMTSRVSEWYLENHFGWGFSPMPITSRAGSSFGSVHDLTRYCSRPATFGPMASFLQIMSPCPVIRRFRVEEPKWL